jgi:hypothetical protein
MSDFTKLAGYFESFAKDDPNYDLVCFIKSKLGEDFVDRQTINNGEDSELDNNDVTMATPAQQSSSNVEGELMSGAFKELDVLNQIKEEKEKVHMPGAEDDKGNKVQDVATEEAFGDNVQNQKHASLFNLLRKKFNK